MIRNDKITSDEKTNLEGNFPDGVLEIIYIMRGAKNGTVGYI